MDAEYYIEHKEEANDLITELAQYLIDYDLDFEVIENPDLQYYNEGDSAYLRFPYAVKLFVRHAEYFIGKPYSKVLVINEELNGLGFWHEDYIVEVDTAEFFYVVYTDTLQNQLYLTNNLLEKAQNELNSLKIEKEYQIRKLEDKLIEVSCL